MFDYHKYDNVFEYDSDFNYDGSVTEAIELHRKKLEGLFIDKVFKLLDVKRPAKIYPPKTNAELRNLHEIVSSAAAADHTKLSLLYYLLLDCDAITGQQTHSDSFEERSSIPKRYQILMKGLWHMDHFEFELALQYLTHPSLIPTFHDEILETLVVHSKHSDLTLPLAYYQTTQPVLTTSHALERLFTAIASTSVTEAFYFSRSQSDSVHRRMFELLITSVLRIPSGENAAGHSMELVNLPFNQEEDDWFENFLTNGEGRSLKKARDTLMMRRIGANNFSQALSLRDLGAKSAAGMNWAMLQKSLHEGLGPRLMMDGKY